MSFLSEQAGPSLERLVVQKFSLIIVYVQAATFNWEKPIQ
jgi:hypothetical protein